MRGSERRRLFAFEVSVSGENTAKLKSGASARPVHVGVGRSDFPEIF